MHTDVYSGAAINKHPGSVLTYQFDWTEWLGADTLATSSWVVETGITKVQDSNTTTDALIKLSGGSAGSSYKVVNTITTTGGLTESMALTVQVTTSGV